MRYVWRLLVALALAMPPAPVWAQATGAAPPLTFGERVGLVLFIALLVIVVIANHTLFKRGSGKKE